MTNLCLQKNGQIESSNLITQIICRPLMASGSIAHKSTPLFKPFCNGSGIKLHHLSQGSLDVSIILTDDINDDYTTYFFLKKEGSLVYLY